MECYGHAPVCNRSVSLKTVLIALALLLSMLSQRALAQAKKTITLNIQNKNIREVMDVIEHTTSYRFFYQSDELDTRQKMSISVSNEPIQGLLKKMFQKSNLQYIIKGNQILLKKKTPRTDTRPNSTQQASRISGKIVDDERKPLPGVFVEEPGTNNKALTDSAGHFSIILSGENALIHIRHLGFIEQTIAVSKIGNRNNASIQLSPSVENLQQIVVTGYQTLSAARTAGSFAQVKSEQLQQRPGSLNLLGRLEGLVSGLNISRSGNATLRGGSSLSLSNQPLVVVDGFPLQEGIDLINPEDVESVNVLKDASAASIWGVSASNGVIVVTTKKGKAASKLTIEASVFSSITQKTDYSKIGLLNASDQVDLEMEAIAKNWYNAASMQTSLNNYGTFSLVNEAYLHKWGLSPDGDVWSQSRFNEYISTLKSRDIQKDWQKYLLRSPFEMTYNVSLSGGGTKNTTYASVVYNDIKSGSRGTANRRLTFTLNDTYKFNDHISFSASMLGNYTKALNNGISASSLEGLKPYQTIYDENGHLIDYYNNYDRWTSAQRAALTGISHGYNVLKEVRAANNNTDGLNLRSRVGLNVKLPLGLEFNSNFVYEKSNNRTDNYMNMDVYSQRLFIADMYVNDKFQFPVGTQYVYSRSSGDYWYFRNTFTWDKTFGEHHATLFGGMDIAKRKSESVTDRKFGYDAETKLSMPINEEDYQAGMILNWQGRKRYGSSFRAKDGDARDLAWYANAAYDYQNKYTINGSFRIDQKNLFGSDPKYRYRPLWSVGLAWNAFREDFLEQYDWINNLRVRATIGINGNASDSFSPYAKASPQSTPFGDNRYVYLLLTSPPNPQLTWETTRVTNLGLDFSLFGNKLNGSIEYYAKNSTHLLASMAIDPTNGFSSATVNYASMSNKGVDINLNTDILRRRDLKWTLAANISYNANKLTSLEIGEVAPEYMPISGAYKIGKPLSIFYTYNYAGLDNTGNVLLNNPDGTVKSWKEGIKSEDELIYQGVSTPPVYGGLTTTISYKNFDLTANLVYKFGYKFFLQVQSGTEARGSWMKQEWKDRWIKPGDELHTRIPKMPYNGINPYSGLTETPGDVARSNEFYVYSQDHVYPGGFIRMRDLIAGYTLPKGAFAKAGISNLRLTAQVVNPLLWVSNHAGIDPEASGSSAAYTNLKALLIGLRLKF